MPLYVFVAMPYGYKQDIYFDTAKCEMLSTSSKK